MDTDSVRELEEISARAWPPLHVREIDGWVLRAAGGVTGRANSVWPRVHRGGSLEHKLAAADDFYARHWLPTLLQLSPAAEPAGLAAQLEVRGYTVARAPRSVQTAELATVAAVGEAARAQVATTLTDGWYEVVASVNSSFATQRSAAMAILAGVRQSSAYVVASIDGVPAAAGRGVVDGDWLGVFNMATRADYRRRGGAASVLAALAAWARTQGASTAYLQMDADNSAAPMLYAKAGFAHAYEYAFWGKPQVA